MRRSYNKEMVAYFTEHSKEHTIHEWIRIARANYDEVFTQKQMRHFFSIRGLVVKPMRPTKRKVFNPKIYEYLKVNGDKHTAKEWIPIIKKKFSEEFTLKQMQNFFVRHQLPMKYEQPLKSNDGLAKPIGSERTKADGMIQVKVGPHKWEYKQRYIYEQYHNVKLNNDEFVIFLDQDRTNFDINNLKVISRHEAAKMVRNGLFSKNKEITCVGIDIAKLMIKTQEKNYELKKEVNSNE